MRRLVKMRDSLVHSIDRDRVLNQIVRADAEKIDFASQRVRAQCRARDLDHRADFRLVPKFQPVPLQLCLAFLAAPPPRAAIQFTPEIIGNMIFTFPSRARAQDRAQLRLEDVADFRGKTGSRAAP